MLTKRYFLIGLKGWVQLRIALRPPVGTKETTSMTVKVRRQIWRGYGDYSLTNGHYRNPYQTVKEPKRVRMTQTVYEGGILKATLKASKVRQLLGLSLREGTLVELLPAQVAVLYSKTGVI